MNSNMLKYKIANYNFQTAHLAQAQANKERGVDLVCMWQQQQEQPAMLCMRKKNHLNHQEITPVERRNKQFQPIYVIKT